MIKFRQKFMVGLPLSTGVEEWANFLDDYKEKIENVYFSVPLGRKFHSRIYIANQFESKGMVEHFYKLLKEVQLRQIGLELVLNTENLTRKDIVNAYNLINENKICVNSVSCLNCYYSIVKKLFTTQSINYSYNNFFNDTKELDANKYDSIILGRYHIRSTKLFKQLNQKNIKVILLLNNGCSHRCGWCHRLEHCKVAFDETQGNDDINLLYAEQSVMPFEIHDGFLDVSNVFCFKINNRNANLQYLKNCMDSYILNDNYFGGQQMRWELWCKLGWFSNFYHELNHNRILEYKRDIYMSGNKKYVQYKSDKMKKYKISLNLCDEYTFFNDYNIIELVEKIYDELYAKYGNYKFFIEEVRLGAESCCELFSHIDAEKLLAKFIEIKKSNLRTTLVVPMISQSKFAECQEKISYLFAQNIIDNVVVNDFGMISLCKNYNVNIILGRCFDKRLRDPRVSSSLFLDGDSEEIGVFSDAYLRLLQRENVSSIEIESLELGIKEEIPSQISEVYMHFPYRYITSGRICELAGIEMENCDKFKIEKCKLQCMRFTAKSHSKPIKTAIYKHCNAIYEKIEITNKILDDFVKPCITIVYRPIIEGGKL